MSINKDKDVTNKYKDAMEAGLQKLGVSKQWSDKHVVFYMPNLDKPKKEEKKWALL